MFCFHLHNSNFTVIDLNNGQHVTMCWVTTHVTYWKTTGRCTPLFPRLLQSSAGRSKYRFSKSCHLTKIQSTVFSLKYENKTLILNLTRSSAVAKRLRDASCLYSFYTLKWCGYPMVKKSEHMFIRLTWSTNVKKIAVFTYRSPHFCFPWRRPCDYHAICCMDGKTIQCLPTPSQHVPICLQ